MEAWQVHGQHQGQRPPLCLGSLWGLCSGKLGGLLSDHSF